MMEEIENLQNQNNDIQNSVTSFEDLKGPIKKDLNNFEKAIKKRKDSEQTIKYKINYLKEQFEEIDKKSNFNYIFHKINQTLKKYKNMCLNVEKEKKLKTQLRLSLENLRDKRIFEKFFSYAKKDLLEEQQNVALKEFGVWDDFNNGKINATQRENSLLEIRQRFVKLRNIVNSYSNLKREEQQNGITGINGIDTNTFAAYIQRYENLYNLIENFRREEIERLNAELTNAIRIKITLQNTYQNKETELQRIEERLRNYRETIVENSRKIEDLYNRLSFYNINN